MVALNFTVNGSLSGYTESGVTFQAVTGATILSNWVYATSNAGIAYTTTGFTPASANYQVSAALQSLTNAGSGLGLLGRYNGTNAGYLAEIDDSGLITLYKEIAGSFTTLGTYTIPSFVGGSSSVVALNMVGSAISVLVGGTTQISVTDTSIASAGTFGLRVGNIATTTTGIRLGSLYAGVPIPAIAFNGVTLGAQNAANTNHVITMINGTPPYTAIVYRSTASGFTVPGSATVISGGASVSGSTITVTDTTGALGQLYFYKAAITDASSQALTTNQINGIKALNKLQILFIGDSITGAYACVTKTKLKLQEKAGIREVSVVNSGVSGSRSNDWITGSSNLISAKSSAVTAFGTPSASNLVYASVMLGVNDFRVSPPGNSASVFKTNMQSLCNDLIASGYAGVILHAPPLLRMPQGVSNTYDTESGIANFVTYIPALDSICNNAMIFKGDRQATNYFAINWGEFLADAVGTTATYVHPNPLGEDSYAALWSKGILDAIYPNRIKRQIKV